MSPIMVIGRGAALGAGFADAVANPRALELLAAGQAYAAARLDVL